MDYERHFKPLKAKTPNPPSKVTNGEQVVDFGLIPSPTSVGSLFGKEV